jgi:hypothetical protein
MGWGAAEGQRFPYRYGWPLPICIFSDSLRGGKQKKMGEREEGRKRRRED